MPEHRRWQDLPPHSPVDRNRSAGPCFDWSFYFLPVRVKSTKKKKGSSPLASIHRRPGREIHHPRPYGSHRRPPYFLPLSSSLLSLCLSIFLSPEEGGAPEALVALWQPCGLSLFFHFPPSFPFFPSPSPCSCWYFVLKNCPSQPLVRFGTGWFYSVWQTLLVGATAFTFAFHLMVCPHTMLDSLHFLFMKDE